jgi:broad specificity phosphatase PhoE
VSDDRRTTGFLELLAELDARHLVGVDGVREVWLVRHADAYGDLDVLAEGRIDPPLSERGVEQARRLAGRLASVPLHAVWSSDLLRARETAEIVAGDRSLAVRTDPRLREVLTHWDEDREPARQEPGSYPFPELAEDVVRRMGEVAADVVAGLDGVDAATPRAVVVTHSATIAIYLGSLLGLAWGQFRVMPQFTSVSVIAVKGDHVVVRSIADATHLA